MSSKSWLRTVCKSPFILPIPHFGISNKRFVKIRTHSNASGRFISSTTSICLMNCLYFSASSVHNKPNPYMIHCSFLRIRSHPALCEEHLLLFQSTSCHFNQPYILYKPKYLNSTHRLATHQSQCDRSTVSKTLELCMRQDKNTHLKC